MMMKTLSCEWCGQHSNDEYPVWGHKETVNSPYTVSHQTPNYCIMAALARVKAAEAERDAALARYEAAEAEVAQWRGFVTAIQERLQVALARVAELEAAQGWRPVTEKPGKEVENGEQGALCLLRSFTKLYGYGYKLATWHSFIVKVWPGVSEEVPGGYWLSADDDGDEIDIDDWQEWQLLRRFPTPPAAATQEPTP